MRLEDFPRPPEDNGRGLHWSPSPYHPTGSALDFWIGELHALHIKWLKLLDDGRGSSVELCRRLIDEGIMPIVRLERVGPMPHHLTPEEKDTIRRLVDVGVRYFELESEPDLPFVWGGELPPDWFERVIDAFIADADVVLDLGGLPAIPAMVLNLRHNPVRAIVERGRRDLFDRGVWWAIHTYTLNRPLDYPDDPVNREGRPVTPEEYNRHYPWGWNEPIEIINRWRAEGAQPDTTLADDPHCFRGFELAGRMAEEVLGAPIPVISTEGGAVTGWRDDRRYPRLSPWTAADWTEQINAFFQERAPAWYFTLCHWLMADRRMDPSRPHAWESHCWYTHYWDEQFGFDGVLPVVERVKAMPSHPRRRVDKETSEETMSERVRLMGNVRDSAGQAISGLNIVVRSADEEIVRATTDSEGAFDILLPRPGTYTVEVEGRDVQATLSLEAGQTQELSLRLETSQEGSPSPPSPQEPEAEQMSAKSREERTGEEVIPLAEEEAPAPVPPDTAQPQVARSAIRGRMPGARPGLRLVLKNERGREWELVLEEDRRFAFTELPPGVYSLTLVGIGTVVDNVVLDGTNQVDIAFPIQGIIQGWVLGAPEDTVAELVSDTYGWTRSVALSPQGQFRFIELPPGTYRVRVGDKVLGPVELDGTSVQNLDVLDLRPPHRAGITGRVRNAEGMVLPEVPVRLLRGGSVVAEGETALNGSYRFENLPEGEYQLVVLAPTGDIVRTVELKQDEVITVDVSLPPEAPEEAPTVVEEATAAEGEHEAPVAEETPPAPATVEASLQDVATEVEEAPAIAPEPEPAPQPAPEPVTDVESVPTAEEVNVTETAPPQEEPSAPPEQVPPRAQEAPPFDIYVLLPPPEHPLTHSIILAALPYLRRSAATAGFSVEEAGRARRVLIVGNETTYGPDVEAALQEAGCEVDRVGEDVAVLVELFRASAQAHQKGV